VTFHNMLVLRRGIVTPHSNPQCGGPPIVVGPRLLILCIRSYPTNLEAFTSTANLRRLHALLTRNHLNIKLFPVYFANIATVFNQRDTQGS
jgi:hypothetical protein